MKKTHFLCPCFRPLHRLRGFRFGSGRHLRHYEPYLRCYRNHNQHQTPTDFVFDKGRKLHAGHRLCEGGLRPPQKT